MSNPNSLRTIEVTGESACPNPLSLSFRFAYSPFFFFFGEQVGWVTRLLTPPTCPALPTDSPYLTSTCSMEPCALTPLRLCPLNFARLCMPPNASVAMPAHIYRLPPYLAINAGPHFLTVLLTLSDCAPHSFWLCPSPSRLAGCAAGPT